MGLFDTDPTVLIVCLKIPEEYFCNLQYHLTITYDYLVFIVY